MYPIIQDTKNAFANSMSQEIGGEEMSLMIIEMFY